MIDKLGDYNTVPLRCNHCIGEQGGTEYDGEKV
jgi:hypothetical protein